MSLFLELILVHLCLSILILGEGPTQRLDDTTLRAGAKYTINFTQSGKIFVLSINYNGNKSFLFVNATQIYQFKTKDSEIKDYTLRLGNISKDFSSIVIEGVRTESPSKQISTTIQSHLNHLNVDLIQHQ